MATLKQKALAHELVKNTKLPPRERKNKRDLLVSAGYDVVTAEASPGRTLAQKGVKEALAEYGLTEELITVALVKDINDKPKNRIRELNLGAEILGLKENNDRPNQQNNFFIFDDGRAGRIARKILSGSERGQKESD